MRLFRLAALAAFFLTAPAFAQTSATPVVPGSLSQIGCSPGITTCYQPYLQAIAGTQTPVTITSATPLTIPAKATVAVITVQGSNNTSGVCAYWRDDGMAPTTTTGNAMSVSSPPFVYAVKGLPIQFIQASGATCTLNVAYYG